MTIAAPMTKMDSGVCKKLPYLFASFLQHAQDRLFGKSLLTKGRIASDAGIIVKQHADINAHDDMVDNTTCTHQRLAQNALEPWQSQGRMKDGLPMKTGFSRLADGGIRSYELHGFRSGLYFC